MKNWKRPPELNFGVLNFVACGGAIYRIAADVYGNFELGTGGANFGFNEKRWTCTNLVINGLKLSLKTEILPWKLAESVGAVGTVFKCWEVTSIATLIGIFNWH